MERIRGLLADADCVIHAGDPDDEGQLIVDELLDYLGYKGKVLRVYVNDNIEKNIKKAFERLVPQRGVPQRGSSRLRAADGGRLLRYERNPARHQAARRTVHRGPCADPHLGLVVNRDEEIEHHVSRKYYELTAMGGCTDAQEPVTFKFKPGKTLLDGEHACSTGSHWTPSRTAGRHRHGVHHRAPPRRWRTRPWPYNLTVLLSDMSRRYGFTAAKTQQITQDLRDKYKAITYNRSDSQYLKEEHHAQAPTVLAQAMRNLGVSWELDYTLHSKAFNEKNVTAHHGIIPQEADAPVEKMTKDEAKVYTAIVERYAMQFLPPARYDVSTSTFTTEEGSFTAVCKRLKDAGFKATFGTQARRMRRTRLRETRGWTRGTTPSPASPAR